MRADDLRTVREAIPFRAFDIVLADGRAFPIPHPDFLSITPKGSSLVLWAKDGSIGSILDATLIAELRMAPANGSKRRRSK